MRVLLVEDDSSTAKAIELSLASEGIICDTTQLGEEGLELGALAVLDLQGRDDADAHGLPPNVCLKPAR